MEMTIVCKKCGYTKTLDEFELVQIYGDSPGLLVDRIRKCDWVMGCDKCQGRQIEYYVKEVSQGENGGQHTR